MDVTIELIDFKTFKHFKLHESPDVSLVAIVGLNGCGKSNLVDGFLYVLGQNSKKTLRIPRFADLIRTGATSCQVTLIVQGGHTFSRSTYAGGESSYKYNDEEKPYEHYMQIIDDIGVVRSVGIYFMLQSSIMAFARTKDKDMTKFLERVSGSIEYKEAHDRQMKQYQEHTDLMMKTRAENSNLYRRLQQAKAQSKATENATHLREQQDKLEMLLALFTQHQLSMQLKDAQKKFAEKTEEIAKVTADLQVEDAMIVQEPQNIIDVRPLIQSTAEKIQEQQLTIDQLGMKITRKTREIDCLQQRNVSGSCALRKCEERVNKLTVDREAKQKAMLESNAVDARALADYNAIKDRLATLPTQSSTDLSRAMQNALQSESKYWKALLTRDDKDIEEYSAKHERYKLEAIRWTACVKKYDDMLVNTTLKSLFANISKTSAKLYEIQQKVAERETCLINLKHKEAVVRTEELQSRVDGLFGRLRDAIAVKANKFKLAIDAGLADMLDATLVETLRTALRCVMFVKAGDGDDSIAKFLINNPEYAATSGLLANIPDSKLLSDMLHVENLLRPAVLHACDDAVVVPNTAAARTISQNMGLKIKVVHAISKMSVVHHANGAVTVMLPDRKPTIGSQEDLGALIGEMRACADQLYDNYAQMADCTKRINNVRKHNEALCNLREAESGVEKCGQYLLRLKSERADSLQELESLPEKYSLQQGQETVSGWTRFCEKYGYDTVESFEAVAFSDGANAKFKRNRTHLDLIEKQLKTEREYFLKQTQELVVLKRKIQEHEGQLKQLEDEKSLQCQRYEKLREYKEARLLEIAEWEDASRKLLKETSTKQCALRDAQKQLKSLQRRIDETNKAIDSHFARCECQHIILPRTDDDLLDLEELPIALYHKMSKPAFNAEVQRFEKEIEAIRDELRKSERNADINIAEQTHALEREHKEAVRRFDEIRAIRTTVGMEMDRLHTVRSKRLTDLLTSLDAKLDQIYKSLYQHAGVCAKILPISADQPYAEGISYMCAPPGKPFLRIADLSAGEGSMAALALHFALWECKPSALFFLDEVDVSMDGANVDKLADYLNAHRAAGLQTFAVTHKPEMAECADEVLSVIEMPNAAGEIEHRPMKLNLKKFK